MEILANPARSSWKTITARPSLDTTALEKTVKEILTLVREGGDSAVLDLVQKYDHAGIRTLAVTPQEIADASAQVSSELKAAIDIAAQNIATFHQSQKEQPNVIETSAGVKCWRESVGIEKVGLYIPGGTAPLFSTILMLGIPARIAGCSEIVLCTPHGKNGIHPAILYAAQKVGITKVFRIGGAQAIAAMAYGTEIVPKVYKIFGPGNQYVTMAKMLVSMQGTAIDMPAGPSEVMVVADETAHPAFIAADLLAQAEHSTDSQSVLLCTSASIIEQTQAEVARQLELLPRKDLAAQSLAYSKLIRFDNADDLTDFMNEYAAEHLILSVKDAYLFSRRVVNAGSVFLGNFTPESAGDYASGTNHTLPTNGFAKAYSGVSLDTFMKKITFQEISPSGLLHLGPAIETMAAEEQLDGHKNAVSYRLAELRKNK